MTPCIGLMSGTSLDGVDGVLCNFDSGRFEVVARSHVAMPPSLHDELLALNQPGDNELHRSALAANALMHLYAQAVQYLLRDAGLSATQVALIGAHGQTVRHRPGEFDGIGYTLQLMNGALLAELCGIDVVCDFRSADVCAGGQGAPLVPAFHAAAFERSGHDVAVVNLGGIANVTVLAADGAVSGFDTGPGNMLMDDWIRRSRGLAFDAEGTWAATGQSQPDLLQRLLDEPFFKRAPPKSTGRDLFNAGWLDGKLDRHPVRLAPADVMATLAELTATTVATSLLTRWPAIQDVLVCGGGTGNRWLMQRLGAAMPGARVRSTADAGVEPDLVEAIAFAWLAHAHRSRQAASLPIVTGARGKRILGALYPATPARPRVSAARNSD